MNKNLLFSSEARKQLIDGVNILADAVKTTMGPDGQNVVIERLNQSPILTKDGVTVARSINLKSQFENLGVQIVKEAAARTAETAGDGTTAATVLTQFLIVEGLKLISAGYSTRKILAGIDDAKSAVVTKLKLISKPISSDEEIKNVGKISANGDEIIGEYLLSAMKAVGKNGVITIEQAKGFNTTLDVVEGLKLDRGYISPYFVTNSDKLVSVLKNPIILILNKSISTLTEILSVLENAHKEKRDLLLIADDVNGEALKALVVNHLKGVLKVCIIRAPEFGEARIESLSDLALLFNTKVFTSAEDNNIFITELGTCKKVEIFRNHSIFVGFKTEKESIEKRTFELKEMLHDPSLSIAEIEVLKRRLARLAGGVAVIRVGGSTELEVQEKMDRVEDALHATQAAVEEGIVPGGGVALIRAAIECEKELFKHPNAQDPAYKAGVQVLLNSCKSPLEQIVTNAGYPGEVIFHKIKDSKGKKGYDARTGNYVDMIEVGIIDPVKVVRSALENATSAAINLLSVGCAITNDYEATDEIKQII